MEGVPTSNYELKVDTVNRRVDIATTSYQWGLANVGLHVGSNVVVDSLSAHNACVIYATGSLSCLGATLSTGAAGSFVLRSGDTMTGQLTVAGSSVSVRSGSVTGGLTPLGGGIFVGSDSSDILAFKTGGTERARFDTNGLFGIGTAPSSTYPLDVLSTGQTNIRASAALNFQGGYYWGGNRSWSALMRGDLDNRWVLRDETAGVDVLISQPGNGNALTTPGTFTVKGSSFAVGGSTFTVSGGSATIAYNFNAGSIGVSLASTFVGSMTAKGALNGFGISTGAAVAASLYGDGNNKTPLGVDSSSAVVRESNSGIRIASVTLTGTGNGLFDLTLSSGLRFVTSTTGIVWADGSTSTSASAGGGAAGPQGPAGTPAGTLGYIADNLLNLATGSQKTFTLTNTPSVNSENVILDGTLLSPTSDYTLSGAVVTMTTAPATACTATAPSNCTSSFYVRYATGAAGVNAAILTSSQTLSGSNTLGTVGTTTTTVNGFASGFWHVIATATASSVASYSFSGLSSSYSYVLEGVITQNTSVGLLHIRYNGDSSSLYSYYLNTFDMRPGGDSTSAGNNAATQIYVCYSAGGNVVGSFEKFSFDFASGAPNSDVVLSNHSSNFNITGVTPYTYQTGAGEYNGTAPLTSVTLTTSAGSFSGRLVLLRLEVGYP